MLRAAGVCTKPGRSRLWNKVAPFLVYFLRMVYGFSNSSELTDVRAGGVLASARGLAVFVGIDRLLLMLAEMSSRLFWSFPPSAPARSTVEVLRLAVLRTGSWRGKN